MNKQKAYFFMFLFLCINTFYWGSSCNEERTVLKIQGKVVDISDQSPINNAIVSLKMMKWQTSDLLVSARTNNEGQYTLTHTEKGYCPESLFVLTAQASGYIYNWSTRHDVKCTEQTQIINFELQKDTLHYPLFD